MVANAAMLTKPDVVAYIGQNAPNYGLDPAAVLAVANQEGLKTDPGSSWVVKVNGVPEPGSSFGPPSWYQGTASNPGAGWAIVQNQGSVQAAAAWSWTPAGLDYWLQTVAQDVSRAGDAGKTGYDAVASIVKDYERPNAIYLQGEINNAFRDYQSFQQQIQAGGNTIVSTPSTPGNITIPPNIFPIPGQTTPGPLPIPSNPQTPAKTTTPSKFSLHLFDLPSGPVNLTLPWDFSGILLFLAAVLAIIIGALMWDKSRTVIVNTAGTAAML